MSSPSSVGGNNASAGIREGTRVILREITANLQNSPPSTSPRRKTGNEAPTIKPDQQHDVKVRFIREFAEATASVRDAAPESSSLSSASSFQSLASTLSSKCSSGICVDSSPGLIADRSYLSADISGLDDLIAACENIHLGDDSSEDITKESSFVLRVESPDQSPDQSFASATENTLLDRTRNVSPIDSSSQVDLNCTRNVSPIDSSSQVDLNCTRNVSPIDSSSQVDLNCTRNVLPVDSPRQIDLNCTRNVLPVDSSSQIDLNCTRNVSPIDSSSQIDLNCTRNVSQVDSSSQIDLNCTRNVLPVDSSSQIDLNCTRNVSPIDSSSQVDPDRTKNDLSVDCPSQVDLNCTRNVLPIDCSNQVDLDRTKNDLSIDTPSHIDLDPTRNDLSIDPPSQIDLDRTINILSFDSPHQVDLDTTRDVQLGNLTIDHPDQVDLDLTKNLSEDLPKDNTSEVESHLNLGKENSLPINPGVDFIELDRTRTIDGEAEAEANSGYESRALDLIQAIPKNCELDECVETVGKLSVETSKIENGPGLSKDEIPLELIAPSFSDFRENLASPVTEIDQSEISPTYLLEQSLNLKNEEISKLSILEFTENLQFPALPALSVQINEISDLPVDKPIENFPVLAQIPVETIVEDRIPEIPRQEILQKFNTTDEFYRLDSISTIRDPSFLNDQNFVVKPIVEDSKISADLSEKNNLETVENFRPLEIDKVESIDQSQLLIESNVDKLVEKSNTLEIIEPRDKIEEILSEKQKSPIFLQKNVPKKKDINSSDESNSLDDTLTLNDTSINDILPNPEAKQYAEFLPQQQSTKLVVSPKAPVSPRNFEELEAAANSVANDILNVSIELAEDNERFVDASADLFDDPTSFDFLLSKTPRKNTRRDLRAESLYINFDPLVSRTSMLPHTNMANATPPVSEAARNGDNNATNVGTPKKNPAIVAIDRLLFYSPMSENTTSTTNTTNTTTTIQKTNEVQEKLKPTEETSVETINMAKELELVRTTVLQLEEQLEKRKIEHEQDLEKEASYKEKINQLQAQLAQEIKNKNEITVVVDEYEISISRLVAERERDRKNLDLERAKLQEELAATKHHLDNTEAAFNDVHLKYERLKAVVATYKSNEIALRESINENVEIIKSLENRYEQVKSHATARLEKANQDLETIRKQSESENVRLHAMLKKAELKSNSLAELVEQKTKENEELTQIFDEVIARVGHDKSE